MFDDNRCTYLSTLNNINSKILESVDSFLTQNLLFDSPSFDTETNKLINTTNDYILSTERFEELLFLEKKACFPYAII